MNKLLPLSTFVCLSYLSVDGELLAQVRIYKPWGMAPILKPCSCVQKSIVWEPEVGRESGCEHAALPLTPVLTLESIFNLPILCREY